MRNKFHVTLALASLCAANLCAKATTSPATTTLKNRIKAIPSKPTVYIVMKPTFIQELQRKLALLIPKSKLEPYTQTLQELYALVSKMNPEGGNPQDGSQDPKVTEEQESKAKDLKAKLDSLSAQVQADYPELTDCTICIAKAKQSLSVDLDAHIAEGPIVYAGLDGEQAKNMQDSIQDLFETYCNQFVDQKRIEMDLK
jgi:hypothetical protein